MESSAPVALFRRPFSESELAIFEHRPARDSSQRRQADLSLEEEQGVGPDDLLDLPLDESEGLPLGPSAAETVPIPTQATTKTPQVSLPKHKEGAAGWGPTVRPGRGTRRPEARRADIRRGPETIGQAGSSGRWLWIFLLVALPAALVGGYFLNRAPAVALLSTEMVDFGELRLGESSQQAFEIRNQGQQKLQIEAFEVQGESGADFAVAGEDCLGRPLAETESCRVRLRFEPSMSGPRKARLAVSSTSVSGLRTLPLLGSGAAPKLEMSPPQLDFGRHIVGSAAAAQVVWIRNGGSANLEIDRVRLEGLAAADFVLRRDECSGQRLEPEARCALRWAFVPTAEGARRASVTVDSDAQAGVDSALEGFGLPQEPELRLDPLRLELAETALGGTSPPQTVQIFNDGSGPLVVHDVRPQDGADGSNVFRLQSETCTKAPIAPGQGCQLDIVFSPRLEGEVAGFFEVLHSAGEGRHLLPLVGNGLAPRLGLEPRRLRFDEVPVGGRGAAQSLRVASRGTAPLRVDAVAVEGADSRAFEVEPVTCLDEDLSPGDSCGFNIRFLPRREGPHRAELVIRHNAGEGVERLSLNGLGTSPKLVIEPSQVSFGEVQAGQQDERTVTLSNDGRAPLSLGSLRLDGDALELLEDRCSGRSLAPGRRCQVRLRFAPQQNGALLGRLLIEHGGVSRPVEVAVRGTATAPPPPRLEVRPSSFDFPSQPAGQASRIQTLVLRNAGQGRLDIHQLRLVGPHADAFQLVPGTCEETRGLMPREECTVGVRAVPQMAGAFEARLEIRHSGTGGVDTVTLRGQASSPGGSP